MRLKIASLCVVATLLLTGCSLWPFKPTSQEKRLPPQKPRPEDLISYLNSNAARIDSIRVDDLDLDAHKGPVLGIGMTGKLVCQKPHNFRLEANGPTHSLEADIGSNDREFWFYIARNNPPALFHCRHDELGRAPASLPFHPDWMLEALGMTVIPSPENFRVEMPAKGDTIELVERSRTPQGQTVYKVTVFNSATARGSDPQVLLRKVVDEKGSVLASARIIEMQQVDGVMIPKQIELSAPMPSERGEVRLIERGEMHLKLTLDGAKVNEPMEPSYTQAKFTRPNWPGIQSFDLARGGGSQYSGNTDGRPMTFRGLRR